MTEEEKEKDQKLMSLHNISESQFSGKVHAFVLF